MSFFRRVDVGAGCCMGFFGVFIRVVVRKLAARILKK